MLKKLIITAGYLLISVFSFSNVLAESKQTETPADPVEPQFLDYVEIDIEGKAHQLKNGNTLQVVKGDKIIIKDAKLLTSEYNITNVNLVGFVSPSATRTAEDRNLVIDTTKDMMPNWAIYKETGKEIYQITVSQGKKRLGFVYLDICEPKLEEAHVNINGKVTKFRHGEIITVNADDKIKVEEVLTNLNKDTDHPLKVQIVPVNSPTGQEGVQYYEIRFLRKDAIFSWIPLHVKQKDKG